MKNLAAQMVSFDRKQMRRIANNLPEQYDEKPQVKQVAEIINGVFSQLLATFPASLANRDQSELNEIRRQWVLAFRENGITTMEQVSAGMRVARRQERAFLPSPGQFVAWCKQGELKSHGLPDEEELFAEFKLFCRDRGLYDSSERYSWKSNALFHMVTAVYNQMRSFNLTDSEVKKRCAIELRKMAARMDAGEEIPPPRVQIPKLSIPVSKDVALQKLAEIRKKLNLPQRDNF